MVHLVGQSGRNPVPSIDISCLHTRVSLGEQRINFDSSIVTSSAFLIGWDFVIHPAGKDLNNKQGNGHRLLKVSSFCKVVAIPRRYPIMLKAPSYDSPQQLLRGRIQHINTSLIATVNVANVVDGNMYHASRTAYKLLTH